MIFGYGTTACKKNGEPATSGLLVCCGAVATAAMWDYGTATIAGVWLDLVVFGLVYMFTVHPGDFRKEVEEALAGSS